MKKLIALLCLLLGTAATRAVVSEPDYILYGLVFAGTNQLSQITAANTNVVIEARRTPVGPALASYTMGSKLRLGDFYSLRVALESVAPATLFSFQPGDTLYLTLSDSGSVRSQVPVVVGTRGQFTRMDIRADNFPEGWLSHLKHPADNAPADNSISTAELNAYAAAWKAGNDWPIAPNPIPLGYVTKAGGLWAAGGAYVFDPSAVNPASAVAQAWWATNAPLWWATQVPALPLPTGNSVVRTVSATYQPGVPLPVTVNAQCAGGIATYAVEEIPPAGWQVSNISDGGVFDPISQRIKWGLYLDNTARMLSYTLTPPANATGDVTFAGQGGFDGLLVAISGQAETGPGGPGMAASISANFTLANGLKLKLKGRPGDNQAVEVSTNLVSWITVTNIVLDAEGLGQFADPDTRQPWRFYRAQDAESQ